jgi:hypothetical protein
MNRMETSPPAESVQRGAAAARCTIVRVNNTNRLEVPDAG